MKIKYKIVFHDDGGEKGQVTRELMGPVSVNHHIRHNDIRYLVFEVLHTFDKIELHVRWGGGRDIINPEYDRVIEDGDQFCCIGHNFIDLQSSTNYAFGDTREAAIANYKRYVI